METVKVSVQCDAKSYWVAIDEQDVDLVRGAHDLEPGEHVLSWWILGKPGQKISIAVTRDATVLASVKASTIRPGRVMAGGVKVFTS